MNVIRKRDNGFHDLQTSFYPLPLKDGLEIIKGRSKSSKENKFEFTDSRIRFSTSGLSLNGNAKENICIKAFELVKNDFPDLPPIQMHLHKAIPIGAGLGGGSSDGAFTLKLLNEKFRLGITIEKLLDLALQLGSDCPFFIFDRPCFASGRGEILEPFSIDLSTFTFVLVIPEIKIDTGWAFSKITPRIPSKPIVEIIRQPIDTWKKELKNDFEETICEHFDELKDIKQVLYDHGAIYASMTGTGSCFYGIFPNEVTPTIRFEQKFRVIKLNNNQ